MRSVTHDSLRYINILTYLLTYLHFNLPYGRETSCQYIISLIVYD